MDSIFKEGFFSGDDLAYEVTEENKKEITTELEFLDSLAIIGKPFMVYLTGATWKVPKKRFKNLKIDYNFHREILKAPYDEKCFE